jgi:hypothetical protein
MVVMSGYLQKRKCQHFNPPTTQQSTVKHNPLSWNKRWFTMTVDSLIYYRRKDSKHPRGKINLSDVTRIRRCAQENGFYIHSQNRDLFLKAHTESDLNRWYKGLINQVTLWKENVQSKRKKASPQQCTHSHLGNRVDRVLQEIEELENKIREDVEDGGDGNHGGRRTRRPMAQRSPDQEDEEAVSEVNHGQRQQQNSWEWRRSSSTKQQQQRKRQQDSQREGSRIDHEGMIIITEGQLERRRERRLLNTPSSPVPERAKQLVVAADEALDQQPHRPWTIDLHLADPLTHGLDQQDQSHHNDAVGGKIQDLLGHSALEVKKGKLFKRLGVEEKELTAMEIEAMRITSEGITRARTHWAFTRSKSTRSKNRVAVAPPPAKAWKVNLHTIRSSSHARSQTALSCFLSHHFEGTRHRWAGRGQEQGTHSTWDTRRGVVRRRAESDATGYT